MIKINVFNSADYDRLLMQRAVDAYFAEREHKSFLERHPELGRMINCVVCGNRHRSSRTCIPIYSCIAGNPEFYPDADVHYTKKQKHGAAAFKGRILKHRNAWGSQVLERATLIYRTRRADPYSTEISDDVLGKQCLSHALNEKRKERALRRKKLNNISYQSRQRNRVF